MTEGRDAGPGAVHRRAWLGHVQELWIVGCLELVVGPGLLAAVALGHLGPPSDGWWFVGVGVVVVLSSLARAWPPRVAARAETRDALEVAPWTTLAARALPVPLAGGIMAAIAAGQQAELVTDIVRIVGCCMVVDGVGALGRAWWWRRWEEEQGRQILHRVNRRRWRGTAEESYVLTRRGSGSTGSAAAVTAPLGTARDRSPSG